MTLRFTPADEDPDRRRRVVWSVPTVLAVLGTLDADGRPHLMNVSGVTPAANDPTRIAVSVESVSKSAVNLAADPRCAISLLRSDQRELGRAFVKPDLDYGHDDGTETLNGVAIVRSPGGAPVLADAAGALCGVADKVSDLDDHQLFIVAVGEVATTEALLAGPASAHELSILRVQETRLNYGR
jgi:flavin reductase (DIM6/NTAB) family NADH-FMN oxidoreductase RutF